MAETAVAPTEAPTLSEHYLLKGEEEKTIAVSKPVEVKEDEKPETVVSEEIVEKAEEPPAPTVEEKTEDAPAAVEEGAETPATAESSSEDTPAAAEETNEATEENSGEEAAEERREIKIETAPADYRFPTTNQTRHCFTRYIEYHRCVAAKGEDASECDKFAKYYRSLCPSEWAIPKLFNAPYMSNDVYPA
ncbi:CYTOCHROME C OXIDASE SUBUNIT 6B [Salix viminalis]|uniref:CYTOCHROME C OXIDASE SUBUNIT 6B n=1 Tax=Salix viminalis TaxID=40686 RepID=A0A9Q0UT42_SALVM|nr:CYTOCHROME C OXIDASE SUBUNIT 6B [Salix viminalis]